MKFVHPEKRYQLQIWIAGMHDDWHPVEESDILRDIAREASRTAKQFQNWSGVNINKDIRILDRETNSFL